MRVETGRRDIYPFFVTSDEAKTDEKRYEKTAVPKIGTVPSS